MASNLDGTSLFTPLIIKEGTDNPAALPDL
jgi:hypothetical protein